VGSVLCGSKEFIARALRIRKQLGGGMRQAGILAAAGLIALEKMPARLHEDHANAKFLATELAKLPGLKIDAKSVQTNILIVDISGTGMGANDFTRRLGEKGLLIGSVNNEIVRFVTHMDVDRTACQRSVEIVKEVLKK
jgi:threonine aldolase